MSGMPLRVREVDMLTKAVSILSFWFSSSTSVLTKADRV